MTPQEEIAAYEAEKREAQLHQFAAAALASVLASMLSKNAWAPEEACNFSWKVACEMMRLKPEPDHG